MSGSDEVDGAELDYGSDADVAPTAVDAAFAQLDGYVIECERTDEELAKLQAQVAAAEAKRKRLVEQLIPEQMLLMRLEKVTTRTGVTIEVGQEIRCSLVGADDRPDVRERSIAWLVDSGNGGVVKNLISIALDRGEDERARALALELAGKGFDATIKKDVAHQTLGKLAREMLEDGKTFPKELFNFYDQKIAKLSRAGQKIGKPTNGKRKR